LQGKSENKRKEIKDALGVHFGLESLEPEGGLEGGPAIGVGMEVIWSFPPDITMPFEDFHTSFRGWGEPDMFKKRRWAQVVREGSPLFPGGVMEIKATVRLVTKDY
jgi:hypothetical protein